MICSQETLCNGQMFNLKCVIDVLLFIKSHLHENLRDVLGRLRGREGRKLVTVLC